MHPSRFVRSTLSTALLSALVQLFASSAAIAQTSVVSTALPTGASVTAGSVRTNVNGSTMTLTQNTSSAIVNWNSFNIGRAATVNIQQPGANAVMLNRVVGSDPSQIQGQLHANGQIMLVNPNGIVVGKDGSVSASGFTASSYGISDSDFLSGRYLFKRSGSAAGVLNEGKIQTTEGGYVNLIGAQVTQSGQIIAPQGQVVMAAAESVHLTADGTSGIGLPLSARVKINVTPATINAAVMNTSEGVIVTSGGQVMLQAAAVSDAVASVTHRGLIDTSAEQGGRVSILAPGGQITVDGVIRANSVSSLKEVTQGGDIIIGRDPQTGVLARSTDASRARLESKGGMVETSGERLRIDGIHVTAASWLLDPLDVVITDTSVNGYGSGQSSANTSLLDSVALGNSLTGGAYVTVLTTGAGSGAGDIYINSPVTSLGSGTLELIADRNLILNSSIQAGSGHKLSVNLVAKANTGNGIGTISLMPGSKILTGGGNINLNGESSISIFSGTKGYGSGNFKHGILIDHALMDAQGGDVMIHGVGSSDGIDALGVKIVGSVIKAGNIGIEGSGGGANTTSTNNHGTFIQQSIFEQTKSSGMIGIYGNNHRNNAGLGHGLKIEDSVFNSVSSVALKGNSALSEKSGLDLTAVSVKSTGSIDKSSVWLNGDSVNGEGITTNLYVNVDSVGYIKVTGTTANANKNAILLSSTNLEPNGAPVPYRHVWKSLDTISLSGNNTGLISGGTDMATGVAIKTALDVSAVNGTTITSTSGGIYLGYSVLDQFAPVQPVVNGVTYTSNFVTSQASINASTGFLTLSAGDGTPDSNANFLTASGFVTPTPIDSTHPYTQVISTSLNITSNSKLRISTDGNGNLYVPNVVMSGSGNVIIYAGKMKSAGDGSGGQVLDTGGTITTSGTGKIFVYSGDERFTGCLACMNPAFAPYDANSLTAPNIAYNRSYQQNALTSTSPTQVIYRAPAVMGGAGIGSSMPAPGGLPSQPSGTSGSTPSSSSVVPASSSSSTSSLTIPQVQNGSNSPVQSPAQSVISATVMNTTSSDTSKADSVLPTRPTVYAPNGTKVSLVRYGAGVQGMDFSLALADHAASESCETEETGKLALASAASAPQAGCMGGQ